MCLFPLFSGTVDGMDAKHPTGVRRMAGALAALSLFAGLLATPAGAAPATLDQAARQQQHIAVRIFIVDPHIRVGWSRCKRKQAAVA